MTEVQPSPNKKFKANDDSFVRETSSAFESELLADATIIAGEGENQKTFKVIAGVLAIRSAYFRTCFSVGMQEAQTKVLRKPNIAPPIMALLLRYLYTNEIEMSFDTVVPLLAAADELGLEQVHSFARDILAELTAESVFVVLSDAIRYQREEVINQARTYILEHAEEVVMQPSFLALDEEIMVDLFSSDDLCLSERDVWRHMLRWGCHQIQRDDLVEAEDFTHLDVTVSVALKQSLATLTTHLRLCLLSPQFTITAVEPVCVVSKDAILDAYRYHLDNSTLPADSVLVKLRAFSTLDFSSSTLERIFAAIQGQFRLNLIYRATRDRFTGNDFHRLCDNQGATLTFVHVNGKYPGERYTAAAYNPVGLEISSRAGPHNLCLLFAVNPANGQGFTCFTPTLDSIQYRPGHGSGAIYGQAGDLTIFRNDSPYCSSNLGTSYNGPGASRALFFGTQSAVPAEVCVYKLTKP